MSTTMDRTAASPTRKTRAPWLIMAAKELRENTKWAAAATFVLVLSTVYQTFSINREIFDYWMSMHVQFQIGAPIIAVLLGLIQIVPEQRRDLLAFVLHRPAPRASLFWGKAAAGLLLYAVVTCVPLLGMYLWATTPGNLSGPFVPQLTLDYVYAILTGIPFYFCSMLAALRPARWYGSRVLPLIAPMPLVSISTSGWPVEFWQACIIVALAIVASAAAARAAFVSQGEFRSSDISSRAGRGGLGFVLYSACAIALANLFAAGSFVSELIEAGRQKHFIYRDYRVMRGGDIGAFTQRDHTLSYHVVYSATGAALGGERHDYVPDAQELNHSGDTLRLDNYVKNVIPFTNPFRYIQLAGNWYQVIGKGQLVSYSQETHLPEWVMGPNGFARYKSPQSVGQFGSGFRVMGLSHAPEFLVDGRNYYVVNTAARTVRKVALPNADQKFDKVTSVTDNAGQNQSMPAYVISTYKQHYVVDGAGHILFTARRESNSSMEIVGSPTGTLYFAYASAAGPAALVSIWSAGGKHIDTISLPQLAQDDTPSDTPLYGAFIPPGAIAGYSGIAFALRNSSPEAQLEFNAMTERWFHPKVLHACLAGLVCIVLAWLIARRAGFTKGQCAAWAFAMFWLGVPGVMMLLAMYAWPTLMTCPSCERKRAVDRELCEHCGSPFSSPSRDGTEILGDSDAVGTGLIPDKTALMTFREELSR